MTDTPGISLEAGMELSGMDYHQLWLRQISVGGDIGSLEMEAYVLGVLQPDNYRHNLLAQAINEHFLDLGGTTLSPTTTQPPKPETAWNRSLRSWCTCTWRGRIGLTRLSFGVPTN